MNSDKENRKPQNNKIELKSASGQYDLSSDALLRHDFAVTEGTVGNSSAVNKTDSIEVVKGWEPISHSFKDLVVEFFLKMRARAFPPLVETQYEDKGEVEDTG